MVTLDAPGQRLESTEPRLRRFVAADRDWVSNLLASSGASQRIRRGALIQPAKYGGYVYDHSGFGQGVVTMRRSGQEVEIVGLAAEQSDPDVLGTLVDAAVANAPTACRRLWMVCHNAEFGLHQVLQRHRFRLCGVRPMAHSITRERLNASHLPEYAAGVAIRDELEFEFLPG